MSDDRKKPSGAEGRTRRKEREAQERVEDAERQGLLPGPRKPSDPPPTDNTAGMVWAKNLYLNQLHEIDNDPVLTPQERWRYSAGHGKVIASLGIKAIYEQDYNDEMEPHRKGKKVKPNDPKRSGSKVEPYVPKCTCKEFAPGAFAISTDCPVHGTKKEPT